jgi:hypothetical protein
MPIFHTKTASDPQEPRLGADDWNAAHTAPDIADVTGLQTALDAKATEGTNVAFTSVNINGGNGSGHIHLRRQASDPSSIANRSTVFADNNGNLAWLNDGLNKVTFDLNGISAARSYEFQDASGTVAFLSDIAGAVPALATVEKNLGSVPRLAGSFTVTGLSGLTIGKPVNMFQAAGPYTGKGTRADEAEMDGLIVKAVVTAVDTITAYWNAATRVKGNVKFNYLIGA